MIDCKMLDDDTYKIKNNWDQYRIKKTYCRKYETGEFQKEAPVLVSTMLPLVNLLKSPGYL